MAQFPLAVPYLLNPVGIVGLMTISAEAKSLSVFAVEFGILVFVLLLDVVVFRWANRVSEKARRRPDAGHRELRLPDRRDRRATGPRRPGHGRNHRARPALKRVNQLAPKRGPRVNRPRSSRSS